MADTALQVIVSPFLGVIFDNISSLIRREFDTLSSFNGNLEKLSNTFSTIRLVLEDAEVKQTMDKSTADWLLRLKDAVYEADDILDDCASEALGIEWDIGDSGCTKQVSTSFSTCFNVKQVMFRHGMGKKIKKLIEKFDEIAAERFKFHLSPGLEASGVEFRRHTHNQETSSILTEPIIYGRDGDKENIIEVLLDHARSENNLCICPIVGIGGLGKTTLAQLIYNDERVVEQFETRIWICISEDFSVKRLTKMMIESLSEKPCDLLDLDPLQNHLKKLLKINKFLLVLDDIWDDDREKWDKLKCLLCCGVNGSSVIVTTRLQTVVDSITVQPVLDPLTCIISPTHNLKFLPEHDSWLLFKQYAFDTRNEEINPCLLEIGLKIVSKCGGVPLAVKALGSLLHFKREEIWIVVRDSEIWNLQELGENTILPVLRLSYNHLTPLSRQCFAFCAVYPKDHEIDKEELIHLWMANGFIQSSRKMEVENIGHEIFDELLHRSFFQDIHEDKRSKSISFKIHDLLHDLACSAMVNECSSMKISEIEEVPQRMRHVSMISDSPASLATLSTLSRSQPFFRTLLLIQHHTTFTLDLLLSSFSRLKSLRVLDLRHLFNIRSLPPWIAHLKHLRYLNLHNTDLASLPKSVCSLRTLQILVLSNNRKITMLPLSIGNLRHLRYLDLSETNITSLPESTCKLTNLQTLKLFRCPNFKVYPKYLGNIRSLRHLDFFFHGGGVLTGMPVGIGQLTCLETLSMFAVCSSTECAGIQELERLNQIKGELTIKGLGHVCNQKDAEQANLRNKKRLAKLNLWWSGGDDQGGFDPLHENISKEVLEGLHPHSNIQELQIQGYPGVLLPSWLGTSRTLPKLISLSLFDMPNVEGWFSVHAHPLSSCLKSVKVAGCPKLTLPMLPLSIEQLAVERCNDPTLSSVGNLPHLSFLKIGGFDEMDRLPEAPLRNLTCLQKLVIKNCKNLKILPTTLENLATLRFVIIINCDELDNMTEGLQSLTSLEELWLGNCRSLKSLPGSMLQHLTGLKTLVLTGCHSLEVSVVDFQLLVTLRNLKFERLPQLTSLPEGVQHITNLQSLRIWECKNLSVLPEWLQHLPPALLYFEIIGCHPDLHRRCQKLKGEDWQKILQVISKES